MKIGRCVFTSAHRLTVAAFPACWVRMGNRGAYANARPARCDPNGKSCRSRLICILKINWRPRHLACRRSSCSITPYSFTTPGKAAQFGVTERGERSRLFRPSSWEGFRSAPPRGCGRDRGESHVPAGMRKASRQGRVAKSQILKHPGATSHLELAHVKVALAEPRFVMLLISMHGELRLWKEGGQPGKCESWNGP